MACGDGTFTFTLLGGRFSADWDVFQTTTPFHREAGHSNDIFDHFDGLYRPAIELRPTQGVELGLDNKPSMTSKAGALGLYEQIRVEDIVQPITLTPAGFDTALLLQSINHVTDPVSVARNLHAALATDGVAYVTTYGLAFDEFYQKLQRAFSPTWVELIERSMRRGWPSLMSVAQWTAVFREGGFQDIRVAPLLRREFAAVWSVGLRPLAPLLIRMSNDVRRRDAEALAAIKSDWVALFQEMAEPFTSPADRVDDAATHLYVLTRH